MDAILFGTNWMCDSKLKKKKQYKQVPSPFFILLQINEKWTGHNAPHYARSEALPGNFFVRLTVYSILPSWFHNVSREEGGRCVSRSDVPTRVETQDVHTPRDKFRTTQYSWSQYRWNGRNVEGCGLCLNLVGLCHSTQVTTPHRGFHKKFLLRCQNPDITKNN